MLKLIIEDDEGRKTVVPFVRDEITVGRQEGNTIRLTERNVSRRHARLVRSNGHVLVEDLGSYNGIRVNGEKIQGKYQVHDGDLIQIGDYDLAIQSDQPQAAPPPAPATASGEHPVNGANGHVESVTEADVQAIGDDEDNEPTAPTPGESEAARRQSTAIIRVDQIEGNRARQVVDIEAEEAPRLVVVNTEFAGREFACIRSELKIGRTDDNDISIDHRSLSRTHAKVVREDGGEWKVIDMQSANGTAVNGETYAQSSLRNGDVITLGHVKLKFVGPGESFRFVPGTDYEKAQKAGAKEAAGGGKSKMPLMVGGGVVAVAIAGLAIFMLTRKPEIPVEPQPKVVIAEPPVKVPEEKKQPVDEKKPDEQVAQKTPDETKKNVEPEPKIAKIDEKLAGAKAAIAAREFDKAQDILQSITSPDGSRPKQVEDMLDEVNAEILFKKNIAAAEKALSGNNLEEAQRLTEESEGTVAYTPELEKLKARLQKAQDAAAKLAAKANTPPPDETKKVVKANDAQNNNKTVKANPTQEAQKLFDEGYTVLQSKQYNEAASIFRHCLELDANFAKCHLYLGVSYAKLKQVDKGAYHYKQFVKLAPNDEQTPKVRKLLEQYEQNKKGTP
ncbi:MAG: FHA domain-containing protein [Myxococcaceae bacterium]